MSRDYTFPETLHDAEFRDSFLSDLAITQSQISNALAHESPASTADESSMSETLSAMHMLRGAAGAIDFKLAFDFAETFHRTAEIGLSFVGSVEQEFLKVFTYLQEAESLLKEIETEVKAGAFDSSPQSFNELYLRLMTDYGDYFTKEEPLVSKTSTSEETSEADEDDLDSFLAMVEAGTEIEEVALTQEPITSMNEDEPADWDVLQYFYQEVDENLTAFEQAILAIEKGDLGARTDILRLTHSTKGAANSMGMYRIAKLMHATEELFERIEIDALHLSSADYSIILKTADIIRSILKDTQEHNETPGLSQQLEVHLDQLPSLGQKAAGNSGSSQPNLADKVEEPQGPTLVSALDDDDSINNTTANTFRIEADKVDGLLNTVGELIISRTRLSNKMDELIGLCQELSKSRIRMRNTLNAFTERFEYTQGEARSHKSGIAIGGLETTAANYEGFSPLELDRYDEFNILSRQITEIGDDTDLAIREILKGGQDAQLESANLSSYISQIQDEIASTRLAPIIVLYKRLERSVRDAAHKAGRTVKLVTTGDELLIDKSILDDLFQPMLHLVRNSVVHAFSSGRNDENTIKIQARQQGGRILISVSDNGAGIDIDRIRELAHKHKNLDDSNLSDEQLIDLIFQPGFSTTDIVDEVSGRGIGLDAVKATIENFGGSVQVTTSAGAGTTFSLHLPLTLAIDQGMYFYVGSDLYAIFMAAVEQVYFARDVKFEKSGEKELAIIEGNSVPVIDLRIQFEKTIDHNNRRESVILCRYLSKRVALKVDRVYYQDDMVVKSMGPFFENHRFFSSATIYGDGEVVPILDISRLESGMHGTQTELQQVFEEAESHKSRILVVDDSLSVRKVCEGYLSRSGYQIDTANDGLDALNKLKVTDYDLVLSDLEMPRLNGLDLLAELKRRPQTSDIPVLIITSRTTTKHQEKALLLGAKECIGKPFTQEQLVKTVESHLSQLV